MQQAAEAVLKRHTVMGLLMLTFAETTQERQVRGMAPARLKPGRSIRCISPCSATLPPSKPPSAAWAGASMAPIGPQVP